MRQYRVKEHLLEPNWVSLLRVATFIATAIAYIATLIVYAKKGIGGVNYNVYNPTLYVGQWVGGPVFLLGLVFAFIRRTKKIGGVIIYLNAAIGLIALGILAFVITETLGSRLWAVVGAVVGAVSLGYGMFAVSFLALAIRGQWLFAALFLFGALFLRWVCKAARRLMYHDLIAANNALPFHPAFADSPESNDKETNPIARQQLSNRKNQVELEDLELEIEQAEQELAIANRERAKAKKDFERTMSKVMHENPAFAEAVLENYKEMPLEEGTTERYERDALLAWKKGDRETALHLYNEAIDLDPDNAVALLNRGNLQIELGNFDEGIDDLERASELDPELPTHNATLFKDMPLEMRESVRQRMLEKLND